jgi:hypothetical protein
MKIVVMVAVALMVSACANMTSPFMAYHTDYGQTTVTNDANPVATNWYFPLNFPGCVLC